MQIHLVGGEVSKILFIEKCNKILTLQSFQSRIYVFYKFKLVKRHLLRLDEDLLTPNSIFELSNSRIVAIHNGRIRFSQKQEYYYGTLIIRNIYTGYCENVFTNEFDGKGAGILSLVELGFPNILTIDYFGKLAIWDRKKSIAICNCSCKKHE